MKQENKISYISPHSLSNLPKNTPVLLALSGGVDSSALLHLLKEDAQINHFKLHAAHFNHHIRGEEAERDAQFCKELCAKFNIPFHLGNADVPSLAKANGNSIEAEAREQRYAFFEDIMLKNNIPILVTAHHAEDQIETILLHILRGSGIKGVCGMSSCREFGNGLYLVRPLLNVEKQDILNFCAKNNISFVTDSTNDNTQYTRNAIRHEIIPKLREIQPNLCDVFERLSNNACESDDFINKSALEFVKTNCQNGIPLDKFNESHISLRARALSILFEEFYGATLERVHIDAIIELCRKAESHSSISLPKKVKAQIENDFVVFVNDEADPLPCEIPPFPFCEGITNTQNGVTIKIEKNPTKKADKNPFSLDIKCDLIDENTHFRTRREGDVIFAGKMNKKAKKLISEKKISLKMRNSLPILVSKNEILWIPSVAVCDRVKADKIKSGEEFFRITVEFAN